MVIYRSSAHLLKVKNLIDEILKFHDRVDLPIENRKKILVKYEKLSNDVVKYYLSDIISALSMLTNVIKTWYDELTQFYTGSKFSYVSSLGAEIDILNHLINQLKDTEHHDEEFILSCKTLLTMIPKRDENIDFDRLLPAYTFEMEVNGLVARFKTVYPLIWRKYLETYE